MAESAVLYIRAPSSEIPPPQFVVEVAKVVLGVPEATLEGIAAELAAVNGYLSDAGRKAILLRWATRRRLLNSRDCWIWRTSLFETAGGSTVYYQSWRTGKPEPIIRNNRSFQRMNYLNSGASFLLSLCHTPLANVRRKRHGLP